MLSLIENAKSFAAKTAIISNGSIYTYEELLRKSKEFACILLQEESDLQEKRIGFLVDPGFDYVKIQWAIWRAGGIAVPLNPKAPLGSHDYFIKDTGLHQLVCSPQYFDDLNPLAKKYNISLIPANKESTTHRSLPDIDVERRAMILYTSGTTGSPKGAVTTHANIEAQIKSLVVSWEWTRDDHIINVLPLHHVHGIINVLCCALWSGATCEFAPFEEAKLFERLSSKGVSLFMAVPTIYFKLITYWESCSEKDKKTISEGLMQIRLMVSGSAALPVSVLEKWKSLSGHTLLERYGMTEIGMAISNSYTGKRIPGYIGRPLPEVEVKLVDDQLKIVGAHEDGEMLVKGPNVFKEYWNKPEATREAFTEDGWFKTGDVAVIHNGNYKIIGRKSIDIIKSGGYKLSALEIEEVLRQHEGVKDCGVVGIPDIEWGEIVAVGLVVDAAIFNKSEFVKWMKTKLSGYKMPRIVEVFQELPRNAMGKVVKTDLKKLLSPKQ